MIKYLLVTSILVIGSSAPSVAQTHYLQRGGDHQISRYTKSKTILAQIFLTESQSFYCGCAMRWPRVDLASCSFYQDVSAFFPAKPITEFEHLYPMARFKQRVGKVIHLHPAACPKATRGCLRSHVPIYASFEADMTHIRPVVKKLNQLRGSKWFATKDIAPPRPLAIRHHCQIRWDQQYFYPPDRIKGDIGRIMLTIARKYDSLPLFEPHEITTFKNWSAADPLTQQEARIIQKIAIAQGDPLPKDVLAILTGRGEKVRKPHSKP